MNICIPIDSDNGLDSPLCLHFTNAPKFIIVNTQTLSFEVLENDADIGRTDAESCVQLAGDKDLEAVVVGGVSLEALSELEEAGLAVYASSKDTVREIVSEVRQGAINPVTLGSNCKSGNRGFGRGFGGSGCCGSHGGCCC